MTDYLEYKIKTKQVKMSQNNLGMYLSHEGRSAEAAHIVMQNKRAPLD